MTDPTEAQMREHCYLQCEKYGEDWARSQVASGSGLMRRYAGEWLERRKASSQLRNDAFQAEMQETASRAASAAEKAALAAESQARTAQKALTTARVAAIIAAIALAASIFSAFQTHTGNAPPTSVDSTLSAASR